MDAPLRPSLSPPHRDSARLQHLESRLEALEAAAFGVVGILVMAGATAYLRRSRVANFGTITATRIVLRRPAADWRAPDTVLADFDARSGSHTDVRIYGGRLALTGRDRTGGLELTCGDDGSPAGVVLHNHARTTVAQAAAAPPPPSSPSAPPQPPIGGHSVDAELAAVGLKRAPIPTLSPDVAKFISAVQGDVGAVQAPPQQTPPSSGRRTDGSSVPSGRAK